MDAEKHRPRLESIQVLRAIAAVLVVLGHCLGTITAHPQEFGAFEAPPINGGVGVDLFFAISGFIIVHSGLRMLDRPHGPRNFLTRRLARIVPLYWAATGATLLLLTLAHHPLAPWSEVASSLVFLPYARADGGGFYPVHDLGWTLNYEIEFYTVFALCMGLGKRYCVPAALAVLCTLVAFGALLPLSGAPAFWTQPIILEFCGGMIVARIYQRSQGAVPLLARCAAAVVAVMIYAADPFGINALDVTPNDMRRVLGWGIPGALMLIAAVWTPLAVRSAWARAAVLLGNASFALYLLHPFALTLCRHVLALVALPGGWSGWIMIGVALPSAAALSIATYLYGEKPLTAWLSRRLEARRQESSGPPDLALSP